MAEIIDRKRIRRNFILALLLVLGFFSMAGCSSSISGTQSREQTLGENLTAAPPKPTGESRIAAQQEPSGENSTVVQQEPARESGTGVYRKSSEDNETGIYQESSSENEPNLGSEQESDEGKAKEADGVPMVIPENLETALLPKEVLIDWIQDTSYTYALVHSEGNPEYGDTLLILTEEDGVFIRTYENDFRELMPWKIDTADIDGDLEKEILIAVKKTTPYDKEIKNRMFIFNYRDGVLVKKWTGSQIAGTWRYFYAEDLVDASGEELIFLEQRKDGLERIKVYYWFDFGFFLLAESGEYTKVKELSVSGENSLQVTLGDGRQFYLTMKDGKLVETKSKRKSY